MSLDLDRLVAKALGQVKRSDPLLITAPAVAIVEMFDIIRNQEKELEREREMRSRYQSESRQLREAMYPPLGAMPKGWVQVPRANVFSLLQLVDPEPVSVDGTTYVFKNPYAAELMTKVSAEVRSMVAAMQEGPGNDGGVHAELAARAQSCDDLSQMTRIHSGMTREEAIDTVRGIFREPK